MTGISGEYQTKGDYHVDLDPNWRYLPVYVEKMKIIRRILQSIPKTSKILDLGCGEGVLVQEYRGKDYSISGLDLHYESEHVQKGSIIHTGFPDGEFDVLLNLDVLEHLSFGDQTSAEQEIARILKPGGQLIISLPNLAHFASRLTFLVTGKLLRTSEIERHPGDRPIKEFLDLFSKDFKLVQRIGLFPTFPLISALTMLSPGKSIGLHKLYNTIFRIPGWCFLNICVFTRR